MPCLTGTVDPVYTALRRNGLTPLFPAEEDLPTVEEDARVTWYVERESGVHRISVNRSRTAFGPWFVMYQGERLYGMKGRYKRTAIVSWDAKSLAAEDSTDLEGMAPDKDQQELDFRFKLSDGATVRVTESTTHSWTQVYCRANYRPIRSFTLYIDDINVGNSTILPSRLTGVECMGLICSCPCLFLWWGVTCPCIVSTFACGCPLRGGVHTKYYVRLASSTPPSYVVVPPMSLFSE